MTNTYTKSTLTREVLEEGVKIRIKSKEHNEAFQKACFKLGAVWSGTGCTYVSPRGVGEFIFVVGCVTTGELLMTWGTRETSKKRPDYRRIFFNDGENKDMEYEPFDLGRALAGEPVILRDGSKAYVRYYETELYSGYPLLGMVLDGEAIMTAAWTLSGGSSSASLDIVGMYPQYKKVNGEKIPLFHDWRPVGGEYCYLANPLDEEFGWTMFRWSTDSAEHKYWMDKGLVYPCTEEGESAASLHSRAMLITGGNFDD